MTRLALLAVAGLLATATVLSPALETRNGPSFDPVPLAPGEPATAPEEGPGDPVPVSSLPPAWLEALFALAPEGSGSNDSQTMGSGELDVTLDGGSGEQSGGNEEPDDPGDDPRDAPPPVEDPFGGIGEGHDDEPVDEWAAMTPEERMAAARRALEAVDDDPEPEEAEEPPVAEDPTDDPGTLIEKPFSVLGYMDDVAPARPMEAYDLQPEPVEEAPADEGPGYERKTLRQGIYLHPVGGAGDLLTPEDPTFEDLIVGQWFDLNVTIPASVVDPDGDGKPDRDRVEARIATDDGSEAFVPLRWDGFGPADGVFTFQSREPLSLAGKSQGLELYGSVTGLDLDSYEGSKTVTIGVDGLTFGAVDVFANPTQHGLAMLSRGLDVVSNVLVAERHYLGQVRSNPEAAGDEAVTAELNAWQQRIDERAAVVDRARTLLADPEQLPIVKLKIGQFYMERLTTADEYMRFSVADQVVPFSGFETTNVYTDLPTMDNHVRILENGIRDGLKQGVIDDVLPAYLMGMYDQFNTWNVPGAFAWTVAGALTEDGPTDHFGRPKSVTHAAVEMGLFVVMIKLPDAIADWAAGGFGANRLPSIGIPRFRGNVVRGGALAPRGPGRLAGETQLGTQSYPGTGGRLALSERRWWQERASGRTPYEHLDEVMTKTADALDELDNFILGAQQKGVSRADIDAALLNARMQHGYGPDPVRNIRDAVASVRQELVIRAANAEGRTIIVHPSEMQEFRAFAGEAPTPNVRQEDLLMINGIKARAEFEARRGGQPMYSPEEVELGRRLLTQGDDLKNWLEFWDTEGGLRHMFDDAAIADLRTVFGGSGPPAGRIAANRGFQRFEDRVQRGDTPSEAAAPANPFDSRAATRDLPGEQGGRPPTQELSPAEMEAAILNAETVRLGRGGAAPPPDPPPTTPAAPTTQMSALDQRVIQKGFRAARGEHVDWTPEELTRLQQIAYPPSGQGPSAVQRKLMPVAEELGGRLETLRVDADDFRAVVRQADESFLAFQEVEDLVRMAGEVGVPVERVRLHTDGIAEGSPVTVLERASRGLLREIDQARGIVYESGVPDDFFVVTRMYFAGKQNGNRLLDADAVWLRERIAAEPDYIRNLTRREFEDLSGEPHTILDPAAADDLQRMYRAATDPPGAQAPATVDPTTPTGAAMLGGPSGQVGASAPVEVVILSTEGSTGAVMEALFVNVGGPVRIQAQGIVLEPVTDADAATLERVEQIRQAALEGKPVPPAAPPGSDVPGGGVSGEDAGAAASVTRVVLDAYCLQADLAVPTRGMLYRIAEPASQAAFGNLRPILEASRRLHEQGALHPSNNPDDYFHSVRQWAIWADEKDMDSEAFEEAFVAHAERNLTAAGQAWNEDVEAIVRDYAPGRWQDVEAVLLAAGVL